MVFIPPHRRNRFTSILFILFFVLVVKTFGFGQVPDDGEPGGKAYQRFKWFVEQRKYPFDTLEHGYLLKAYNKAQSLKKSSGPQTLSAAGWIPIGPAPSGPWSGRVSCLAVHPTNGNIVYIGAADGGVWKTTNAGSSWTVMTDDQPTLASGALAIDPQNPGIIYWGTGEPYNSIDSYGGVGLLKSTNGGATWSIIGLTNEKRFTRLAVNRINTSLILAMTWGGIYRSTNAGATWTKTSTFSTGWDVVFDPSSATVAYATGTSGVYKSTDGGVTWFQLTNGSPAANTRSVLAIARSSPNIVYVLGTNNTFYKSTNSGSSWTQLTIPPNVFGGQGWYNFAIDVSPDNPNIVHIGGVGHYRSTDGGTTWANINNNIHADVHAIEFGPQGSNIVHIGHDGGVSKSVNGGASWTTANSNLATTQFYSVGLDRLTPSTVWGGTQDNGTQRTLGGMQWDIKLGADGGIVNVDYTNSNVVYAETQNGKHYRFDGAGWTLIQNGISGSGAWVTPVVMDPITPSTLYTATSLVYKTTNRGDNWVATTSSVPWGGVVVRQLAVPATSVQTVYAAASSSLYRSDDRGANWTNVSSGLPSRYVTSIVPHPTIASLVFVTVSGTGSNHVFKSTNAGNNWTSISGNLPTDLPVNSIVVDPTNISKLFIGTDLGIWFTMDGGASWAKDESFPNVAVVMLDISSDNYLVAATHGRSMFKTPLNLGPFLFVTSPNGGEQWVVNSSRDITWMQNGANTLAIDYSTNAGSSWKVVTSSVSAAAGSYMWTVPNEPTTQGLVRVRDVSNSALTDVSNGVFSILAPPATPVLVSPPNGSVDQPISPTMRWRSVAGATSYNIQLSSETSFASLMTDANTSDTSFTVFGLPYQTLVYWRVRAISSVGSSAFSGAWNFQTAEAPPPLPTLLSPASGVLNQPLTMTLRWSTSPRALWYHLQVATNSSFSTPVIELPSLTDTTRVIGPLTENTKYYWRVSAKNAGGSSGFTVFRTFTTGSSPSSPPATPVLSSPANGATEQSTTPTLAWNASSGASTYRLQVSSSSSFTSLVFDDSTLTGTSRQVGPLNNNTTYYWRVNAKNGFGTSTYSATWSLTTQSATPTAPPAPVLLSPANGSGDQPTTLTLSWNAASGATSYRLQVATNSSFTSSVVDDSSITATSRQVSGLANGTTYYWRVNGRNSGGTGPWSSSWQFTTIVVPPPSPTLVAPVNGATGQPTTVTLSWNASAGATSYRVQVSTSASFSPLTVDDAGVTATSKQVTGLSSGMTHYWRVSASNGAGTSSYSSVWTFVTTASPPPAPTLVSPPSGAGNQPTSLTLTWNESPGAMAYRLQLAKNLSFSPTVIDEAGLTQTSYAVGGLSRRTTYYWRVNASNTQGESGWSDARSFKTSNKNGGHTASNANQGIPTSFALGQNFPNPFNPSTVIEYELPERSVVQLSILNMLGQEVARLVDEEMEAGFHDVVWETDRTGGQPLSSGVYAYRLIARSLESNEVYQEVRTMLLLK